MENQTAAVQRHVCLPKHLNSDEIIEWLKNNAVETFKDTSKHYYSPEEVTDFEHESSINGREFNRLKDIVKQVSEAVTKGNLDEPLTITIPVTLGTKILEMQRRQNDDMVEKGYDEIETLVYAIPSAETSTMEFFTEEGKHVADRSRPMSNKEKHQYIGVFLMSNPSAKLETVNGEVVDTDSGNVVLGRTGSDL